MPSTLRNAHPIRWQPTGIADALDGTNTFAGAMQQLANMVPDPSTDKCWVCRPAAQVKTLFPGFIAPGFISAGLVVGDVWYGMIASGRNSGKDEPFAYNLETGAFYPVSGITAANTPISPPSTGDWTPPIVAQVAQRILVTHPGFPGGTIKFGWFDISGFSDATHTGNTHSSKTIDTLSANVLQAGWQPGYAITDSAGDLPPGTTIVSVASDGMSAVISNAATASNSGVTFAVTGGTPTAPQWSAGDTNINNLPSVPLGVAQMSGRAYFVCGVNGIPFSDSGLPCNRTNASQALTTNDGLSCTAIGPLPLSNLLGGIVQALIVFEGVAKMQQITGDSATSNLTMNSLPVATGTFAPLSLCPTELGLGFISPEGMRFVTFQGTVTQPYGDHGQGTTIPFIYTQYPTRTTMAANADTIRISVFTGNLVPGSTYLEYWYDITRKAFYGPQSFAASQIELWRNTFAVAPTQSAGSIWQSDVYPSPLSTYAENGAQLQYTWATTLLPDNAQMSMNSIVQMSLMCAFGSSGSAVNFISDQSILLDSLRFGSGGMPSQWDAAVWDESPWDGNFESFGAQWDSAIWDQSVWGNGSPFIQQRLAWHVPLVFKQAAMQISGNSDAFVRLGNLYMDYQTLGYMLEELS